MNLTMYCILWLSCILGNLAVLPYVLQLTNTSLTAQTFLLASLQAIIIWGIIVFLGMRCAAKANFKMVAVHSLRALLMPSMMGGFFAGWALILLDRLIFTLPITAVQAGWMQGLLLALRACIINDRALRDGFIVACFLTAQLA